MSDNTWVSIEVSAKHNDTVTSILGQPEDTRSSDGICWMQWLDVNYGGYVQHDLLVEQEIPHIITWGAGRSYGSGSTVYFNHNTHEIKTCHNGDLALIEVSRNGTVSPGAIQNARNYYSAVEEFRLDIVKSYYNLSSKGLAKWLREVENVAI